MRRGRACGRALPSVLPRRDHQQPDRLGPLQAGPAHQGDRLAAKPHRAPPGRNRTHERRPRKDRARSGTKPPPPNTASPSPSSPWAARAAACRRLAGGPGRAERLLRTNHLGARCGAAHRRHRVLPRDVPRSRHTRRPHAGDGAQPHSRRRGRRDRLRIHGGRPRLQRGLVTPTAPPLSRPPTACIP